MKQWSLDSVVYAHNYDSIQYTSPSHHDIFINWINSEFNKKIDVIDIGGGNGRIYIPLKPYVNNYTNLDLSPKLVEISNEFFKNDPSFRSVLFDVDVESIPQSCDVIYIDSVLTMLEDPILTLTKLIDSCEFIFINRTDLGFPQTIKTSYQWGGMSDNSPLWQFNIKTIIDFVEKYNSSLKILQKGVFVIQTNKKK